MTAGGGDDGVPLGHYRLHHPDCGVRLICASCNRDRRLEVAAVAARLRERGVADPDAIGIRALARWVREPCSRCGGRRFKTLPDFSLARPAPAPGGFQTPSERPIRAA